MSFNRIMLGTMQGSTRLLPKVNSETTLSITAVMCPRPTPKQ